MICWYSSGSWSLTRSNRFVNNNKKKFNNNIRRKLNILKVVGNSKWKVIIVNLQISIHFYIYKAYKFYRKKLIYMLF